MNLREYAAIARRRGWIVVLGCLLGLGLAWAWTERSTAIYEARAVLLINQVQNPAGVTYQDILGSQQLTKTYAELVTSNVYLERVSQAFPDRELDARALQAKVSADALPETQLLEITVEDPKPVRAAAIADTVARLFPQYIEEAQLAGKSDQAARPLNTVFITETPVAPDSPVRPNLKLNLALGLLTALVVSMLAVAAIEYFDDTITSREDVEALGLSLLATVALHRRPKNVPAGWTPTIGGEGADPEVAESYRQLQASIGFALEASRAKTLLVTSADSGDGKSTTAVNLAEALAESARRVLLIDGDLRRPDVHAYLGLPNSSGLSSAFLADPSALPNFLRRHPNGRLFILTSGPPPPNPVEMLGSRKMRAMLSALGDHFEVIVIDSPPILGLADASVWAAIADGIVLVARQGRTRSAHFREAIARANSTRKPILGVVINGAKRGRPGSAYAAYGYAPRSRRDSTSA